MRRRYTPETTKRMLISDTYLLMWNAGACGQRVSSGSSEEEIGRGAQALN